MSLQENDNAKKDLPQKDKQQTGTALKDGSRDLNNLEGANDANTEQNAFSGSSDTANPSTQVDKDQLEMAMIQEKSSSALRAESRKNEEELSDGEIEASAPEDNSEENKNTEDSEKSIEDGAQKEASPSTENTGETSTNDAENSSAETSDKTSTNDAEKPSAKTSEETSTKYSEDPSVENTEETSTKDAENPSAETSKETNTKDTENPSSQTSEETSTKNAENPSAKSSEETSTDDAENHSGKTSEETSTKNAENPSAETPEENLSIDEGDDVVKNGNGKNNAHSEFEDSVAEDSEDETTIERHGIEKKDYHSMSKEELVAELEKLLKNEKVQAIKEHVEEIKNEFNSKFDEELEEKKEDFLADGGNIIDFHYSTPLKKHFNSVYFDYKEKRNKYYQQLKQDLNKNLDRRQEIIEELKGLLDVEENINTTYKHFKELQERWRTAGPIPRDKYNTVWNTYHHHVENFYDFLHLNRDFRDMDFKHNLEQKLKVIDRAEELTQEPDTSRAFRELQMLHKMWKEELGPVAKEYREDIWSRFSEATKKIHDLRQAYYDQLDQEFEKNLEVKHGIIEKIKSLAATPNTSHSQWQQKIKELETMRDQFFKAGKVPRDKNEETWSAFKQGVRQFNRNKNAYYKGLKKEQYDNLEKKKELIQIAEDNKDNEDFKATTPLMKKVQADWKKVGHVPRKDSDKVWKQFKAACNHYFERLHKSNTEENSEEQKAFDQKKELLDSLKSMEFAGDKKQDLPKIKAAIEEWKHLGKVPFNKRFIEGKFNKLLDQLFSKLDVDNTKAEMMKYENKVQALNDADDDKKIRNEHYFLSKKVEETKAEIRQLENNLQFFSNVDDKNPLVQEVHKNIQDHKDQLTVWKEKLQKIKSLY